jgi:hypothetical protein
VLAEASTVRPRGIQQPRWSLATQRSRRFRGDNASQSCGLCRSYFVAGVVVVFLVVVVFVAVVFFSEVLQPANVKAANTRTADSVRITFLIIIPLRHIIGPYISLMFERVGTSNTHQTTIISPEDGLAGEI